MNKSSIYVLSLVITLLCAGVLQSNAQSDKRDVRKGNRDFRKEEYREAEIDYRKALVKDSLSVAANYNLANALYKSGDTEQAFRILENIKDVAKESGAAADYYYNLGDVAVARQDWQTAVDAFKQSLLLRPDDLDAKENYIYARKKLQDQQNQNDQNQNDQNQDNQNQNDQDQDNQNDQNEDQNNQDQNDQDRDQNEGDQNQDNRSQEHQNNSGEEPKITPQAAQQMLQAIQAKEKETQDKVNKRKAEALKSRQRDKNW